MHFGSIYRGAMYCGLIISQCDTVVKGKIKKQRFPLWKALLYFAISNIS